MAPTKRARPSFSPPRPGKSKSTKSNASISRNKASSAAAKKSQKSYSRKGARDESSDPEESEENDHQSRSKNKSKNNARSFIMDEASASSDEEPEVHEDEDNDEEDDEGEPEASTFLSQPGHSASPEPDMILAEVEVGQPSQSPIPEALVQKMISHHFTTTGNTKMSRDARDLVTKYIEVFVREAIMRSAFERQEKDGKGGGFLEVEDLERAAVQLCLDF